MIDFSTIILQFGSLGEKTGWTYVEIPADLAQELKPGNKQSFRVKGHLDNFAISGCALIPMGEGNFILSVNAAFRKGTGKNKGAMLRVRLEEDRDFKLEPAEDLVACLEDEPGAMESFKKLPGSHQRYYIKWIESAKTEPTRVKRIANTVNAMVRGLDYGAMLRAMRKDQSG